jgi:NAD(P)-dependent dehydrogenase (short-subunit alcohol dehydrogenase family)
MRLAGKAGIVVGAGQTPGKTAGTGRAAALLFAREGAQVMLADRDLASALQTAAMIADAGGVAECVHADWTNAADRKAMATACLEAWGRIDVLSCQAALPAMRDQEAGSIVNVSSIAALARVTRLTAYKLSKAAIHALSQSLAVDNAAHGIRVNTIMPGLLDTPMAVDARAAHSGLPREQVVAQRAAAVPLRGRWARPGTSRTRACSSTPTRRNSSREPCCPSTAVSTLGSADSQPGQGMEAQSIRSCSSPRTSRSPGRTSERPAGAPLTQVPLVDFRSCNTHLPSR